MIKNGVVATIISGNSSAVVWDAIQSVAGHIDGVILVDTGITDGTREHVEVACSNLHIEFAYEKFPWVNDFAKARNFALKCAKRLEAAWALTLDTDERLVFTGSMKQRIPSLRDVLGYAKADVINAYCLDGTYEKPRLIRPTANVRWVGETHEYLDRPPEHTATTIPDCRFTELPKTPAQYKVKFERDLEILKGMKEQNPDQARWFYYLGDTLRNLHRPNEAAEVYAKRARMGGWNEEAGFAAFRAAELYFSLGRREDALDMCLTGMKAHPGMAENAWLAGYICYQQGQYDHAIYWARLAVAGGVTVPDAIVSQRISFRHWPALKEGPFDILRFAYKMKGMSEAAQKAEEAYHAAKALA